MDTWEEEQAARTGAAIKELRGKRSAQWLADRVNEIAGLRLTRQTIADLESGRRRYVTTAELIALAAALNVPPIVLLYPGPDYATFFEVIPGIFDRKMEAVQWFSGVRDHGYADSADGAETSRLRAEYRELVGKLDAWREFWALRKKIESVTVRTRMIDGKVVRDKLSDRQIAQLDAWHEREQTLRRQLGLGEHEYGG